MQRAVVLAFTRSAAVVALLVVPGAALGTNVSGTISANTTWTTAGSPYIVTGSVYVEGASVPVLTIQAGVMVKFNAGTALIIGNQAAGGLSAVGTSGSPITFTANGSTSPGFWQGIQIMSLATATSKITWATVTYGGTGASGGVRIVGPAVTLTRVTSQNNSSSGVSVESGSPVVKTCTLSSNPWGVRVSGGSPTLNTSTVVQTNTQGGIWLQYPASASLQTVSISNNTGYAISQDNRVTLGTISSLTASGNTTNAIEIRGGPNVDVNTTWKSTGLPYVVTGTFSVEKNGTPVPVLTVAAGTTVKFAQNVALLIGNGYAGELQANGTSGQLITFTASSGTSPGYWGGLQFQSSATSTSKVSYATVSYGANGIYVQQSSPTIQNVTLLTNTTGLSTFQATPKLVNCNFVTNTAGLTNQTPTTVVTAGLNYWGAASGPSGSGPGTGQSVSAGVSYEPWLIAAPTNPNYLNTFTQKNRTFNPAISINTTISSGSAQSAAWTTTILNGATVVRTYSGTGTTWSVIWDGKNGSGVDQPNGTYNYQLQTGTATVAKGLTVVDRTRELTVSGYTVAPSFFSPNGDGVQDTATASATFNFDDVSWTLRWKNPSNVVVRTLTGTGASMSYAWDGTDGSGLGLVDNPYTAELTSIDGTANVVVSGVSTLDKAIPVGTVTAPTSGQTISNVYQNGVSNFDVLGSASDLNIDNWKLDDQGLSTIATGTTSISGAKLATWATLALANGSHTLQLQVWDKAGNYKSVTVPTTVGNFQVTQNSSSFDPTTGGTVTYTSTIPFPLTETLVIKNAAGQTVKTLVNAVSRSNPSYQDTWNGVLSGSTLVSAGDYYYVATVTAGSYNMTFDLTSQYWGNGDGSVFLSGHTLGPAWDPFRNQPLAISYNFPSAGRIWIAFSPDAHIQAFCPPPDFCAVCGRPEPGGNRTFYWAGVDSSGRYRPEATYLEVISTQDFFSKNAVVLFGYGTAVTPVTVTPPLYSPPNGAQTISYQLVTYLNATATVTITFLNQDSMTVLRTLTQTFQTPGARTATWDGKADNGTSVAPGSYLVTVTAVDPNGNVGYGQIMTTVRY